MKRYRIKVESSKGQLDRYFPQVETWLFGKWLGFNTDPIGRIYPTHFFSVHFTTQMEAEKIIFSYRCEEEKQEEKQKVKTSYIKIK